MDSIEKFAILRKRSEITESVRSFFLEKNYLQVETPVLAPHVIPEAHIEIFKTELISPYEATRNLYLLPSPELWMKELISKGSGSIFQICKSFRNYEQNGSHHNPEFTMLEWYTVEADYNDSLMLMEKFLRAMFVKFRPEYSRLPFTVVSIRNAFLKTSGIDILKCPDTATLKAEATKHGFDISDAYTTWEEIFNRIFLQETEPTICKEGITVLTDYPEQIPCLARHKKNEPFYERWELYVDGIELANCYTEETASKEVQKYYKTESMAKEAIAVVHVDVDTAYSNIFKTFPKCSGTALGMDRLVMILTGANSIQEVLSL